MIKHLKRRFVFVNMSILTCVLVSVLVAIFALMYSSEVKLSYELMESILSQKDMKPHPPTDMSDIQLNNNNLEISPMSYSDSEDNIYSLYYDFNNEWFGQHNGEPMYTRPYDDKNDHENADFPMGPEVTKPFPPSEEPLITTSLPDIKPFESTTHSSVADIKDDKIKPEKDNGNFQNNENTLTPTEPRPSLSEKYTATAPNNDSESSEITTIPSTEPIPKETFEEIRDTQPDPFKGKVQRSYVYVEFSENETITEQEIYQYLTSEDDESIKSAVQEIYSRNDERGKISIGSNQYRYIMRFNPVNSSYSLIMLDRTLEINTINRLLFIFVIIACVALLIIFFISMLLANWTIKPVAKAWQQQKEFIANASHELKTPLTVISTNTDVVLSNPNGTVESQKKWLDYIKNETVRMSKLVNNLLCIAKYDAKKIDTTFEKINLSNIAESISLQYEPLAFENKKTLISDIDKNLSILGDEDKIKQVINILMDNALKYAVPDGTVKISLKKNKQSAVCLTVSNSSEYISQEQLDKIFERFYRVDSSRNRKTGGSGLGLNIAKTIIDNHKGTINVVNKDGITSFIVVFQ